MGQAAACFLVLALVFGLGHAVGEASARDDLPPPVVKEVEVEVERVVTKTNTVEVPKPLPDSCRLAVERVNESWVEGVKIIDNSSKVMASVGPLRILAYERDFPGMIPHQEVIDQALRDMQTARTDGDFALQDARGQLDRCNSEYLD